jgi:hypothetical protein
MEHAIELEPAEHLYYHALAPMLVQVGDLDEYRKHCQREAVAFQATKDPTVACRMSMSCSLVPESGVSSDLIMAWANLAISAANHSDYFWFKVGKGLADYRRGDFSGAVKWMADAENTFGVRDPDWGLIHVHAVTAMAYARLNQPEAARKALSKATELQQAREPEPENRRPGLVWLDWIGQIQLKEATSLIGAPAPQAGGKSP